MKSKENLFGAYVMISGVVIAIILGLLQASFTALRQDWVYYLIAIMGIMVGFASVGKESKEATTFLLASVSLVIVSALGQETLSLGGFGVTMAVILDTLLLLFIPATIVVALKTVFSVAYIK